MHVEARTSTVGCTALETLQDYVSSAGLRGIV